MLYHYNHVEHVGELAEQRRARNGVERLPGHRQVGIAAFLCGVHPQREVGLQHVDVVHRGIIAALGVGCDVRERAFDVLRHLGAFPDMKCTLYDSGIGVSLILKYPGNPMAGQVCDALVSHLDLYPTVCRLAGVPEPEGLQGASLLPLLEGTAHEIHPYVFSEINFHVAYEPVRCVRGQRFKYIRRYSAYDRPMPSNCDDSPAKAECAAAGFYQRRQPAELLFDLVCDPLERVNLAQELDFAAVRRQYAAILEAWMRRTGDPLLEGTMIPPKGALVNYPDSPSPAEKVFIEDFSELI